MDFFQQRWNFRLNTICWNLRNRHWFTGAKYCCSQFFADSEKVRFHCYSPQLKWNQAVLLLKQWCGLLLTSLKFALNHICWNIRNDAWFIGAKDFCSQFFADSAKYVSIAIVHSWNGIKPFFYTNNDVDFFWRPWNFRLNNICCNIRNDDWFIGAKDCCSQFLADSAEYVSIAIVHSWNAIKPFFYSNNDVDFF